MERNSPVIRLSVPFRQALSRLTLPVMLMFSLGLVLIGRADQNLSGHLRSGLDDLLAPAYLLVSGRSRRRSMAPG